MNSENTTSDTPHIVVVVAGTNDPSNTDFLAEKFIEGVKSAGATISKIRLKDLHIKHFTLERYSPGCTDKDDDFATIESLLRESDGIVIASPIWNFSVPAHLKNLIDRMGAFALDTAGRSRGQLKGKPFFMLYAGGAPMIAWKALLYLTTLHMTEAIKYYDGIVIGKHFEPKCVVGRGKFGLVVDQRPATIDVMKRKGERFARIAKAYKENGTLPLRTRIAYNFFSFLYRVGNRVMYPVSSLQ